MKIICIMGPTCSGKTDLAIQLSELFPVHLISVDSALIYRDMNIGTAKPDMELHPHALVDICDPREQYSVAQFIQDVEKEILFAQENQKTPVLVGGTMMYFNALQYGIADIPETKPEIREKMTAMQAEKGTVYLHEMLKKVDPVLAKQLNEQDTQRVMRALEVYESTQTPLSVWQQGEKKTVFPLELYENILLIPTDRARLHAQIAKRFQIMLEQGFLDEVKMLRKTYPIDISMPSMRSVGYRQAMMFLEDQLSFEEMCNQSIAATRQLAKRQLTWLRSWQSGYCVDVEKEPFIAAQEFLK